MDRPNWLQCTTSCSSYLLEVVCFLDCSWRNSRDSWVLKSNYYLDLTDVNGLDKPLILPVSAYTEDKMSMHSFPIQHMYFCIKVIHSEILCTRSECVQDVVSQH